MKYLFVIGAMVLVPLASTRQARAESTDTGGAAYASLCAQRQVPLPPPWGSSQWKFNGTLEKSQLFIVTAKRAHAYYYQSTSPPGLCMALPRGEIGSEVTPRSFGVICQGSNGKVCFWDNKQPVPWNSSIVIASTSAAQIPNPPVWLGGADLDKPADGGVCTDCHAGENAFIVHPGTPLDLDNLGISQDPSVWPNPIVIGNWPQNVGPGVVPSATSPPLGTNDGNCLLCHQGGQNGGRFPTLSVAVSGYCNAVLRTSFDRKAMPPFATTQSYQKHWDALFNACNAPAPPQPVRVPSVRDALDPAVILTTHFTL